MEIANLPMRDTDFGFGIESITQERSKQPLQTADKKLG